MRVSTLTALAAMAALSGIAGTSVASQQTVTFVETVRSSATVCEAQRKTIPVLETVRAPDAGDLCVEYTRTLTGFKSHATLDPAIRIKVPLYEQSEKRYVSCGAAPSLVSSR
jgi:hypothetical protein